MTSIFVIEELWLDPSENYNAYGYKAIGFVKTRLEAGNIVKLAGNITGDGWPLEKNKIYPKKRFIEMNEIENLTANLRSKFPIEIGNIIDVDNILDELVWSATWYVHFCTLVKFSVPYSREWREAIGGKGAWEQRYNATLAKAFPSQNIRVRT